MIFWNFDPELNNGVAARHFATLDQVFALEGELITHDPVSRLIRIEREGRRYYVKCYAGSGKKRSWLGLRQLLVPPRIRSEWQNLLAFAQWGIPTARLAAYGIERRWGAFRRGALITEEIRNTTDMAQLVSENDPRLRDRYWLDSISAQLADITRRMHTARFAHNDLKWRNLLVSNDKLPRLFLIDCPWGGFWIEPFLSYRIIKDLACLDKVAKQNLSRTRRLRFYLDYVQRQRLSRDDKKRIRKIVRFFEGRE